MKQPKGTVGVEVNSGRLRLRLPRHLFSGQQRYLYLGLLDTKTNRKVASAKAAVIEADILFERFDPSMEKYKSPVYSAPQKIEEVSLSQLWGQYTDFKSKILSPSSMKDFRKVANHLALCPYQFPSQAKEVLNYFQHNLSPDTTRRCAMQLSACCEWAVDQGLLAKNSFLGLNRWLKSPRTRNINPFTISERDIIIHAFENLEAHQHYANLVKFFFMTGCRTSEAVGLTWEHIDIDLTSISFQEAVVEGTRFSTTKTKKSRLFPINESLKGLMLSIKPPDLKPNTPVFTDTQGNLVRPNNFLRRHWKPVVRGLPIRYRPQYNTRHTFITLCLQANVPVAQVAAWVGNSPRVIWDSYAGFIPSEVPEF